MKKLFLPSLLLVVSCTLTKAQELPPIFKDTPKQIVSAKTLASFPQKTFLENLILLPDGSLLANSHFEGVVYKITSSGEKTKFASVKSNGHCRVWQ
jgi:hypothetical protein